MVASAVRYDQLPPRCAGKRLNWVLGVEGTACNAAAKPRQWPKPRAWSKGQGARVIEHQYGCPAQKSDGKLFRSALIDARQALEPDRSGVNAVKVPVTLKTRLGWDATCLTRRKNRCRGPKRTGITHDHHPRAATLPVPIGCRRLGCICGAHKQAVSKFPVIVQWWTFIMHRCRSSALAQSGAERCHDRRVPRQTMAAGYTVAMRTVRPAPAPVIPQGADFSAQVKPDHYRGDYPSLRERSSACASRAALGGTMEHQKQHARRSARAMLTAISPATPS